MTASAPGAPLVAQSPKNPADAILGAVLLTGYIGGIIVTHLRGGEGLLLPILLGLLVWAGVYLRDDRLRAVLPLRKLEPRG